MTDIDVVINDVREAVEFSLRDRVISTEDIVAKVRALVVPVLEIHKREILERDMKINHLETDVYELTELLDEREGQIQDRANEDERQALIRFFQQHIEQSDKTKAARENRDEVIRQLNLEAKGEAVYS